MNNQRLNILGVGVDPIRLSDCVERVDGMIREGGSHHIVTVNPEFIMYARRNPEYRKVLNNVDLATADGFGVRLAATYLKQSVTWFPVVREAQILWQGIWTGLKAVFDRSVFREVPELVTGIDLVWALAKLAEERGYSLYLLDRRGGLAPDTPKRTAERLKLVHPKLKVVGAEAVNPEDPRVIRRVQRAKPDILLVAFGFPQQDLFIARHKNQLEAKVAIGVGGTFDYIAGNRRRPPRILRAKFEWLWRLLVRSGVSWEDYQRRAKRIFTAFPLFPLAVFQWKLRWGAGLGWIKAVALDFGGVLNANGVERVLRRAWLIVPPQQLPALALFYFRYIPLLERGTISEVEVWTNFLRYFGTKRDLAALRQRIIDGFTPNEPIWDLVRGIKMDRRHKLALLTNNIKEWMAIWEKRFKLSKYFNPLIASCFVGKRKPNPAIFRMLIRDLGVPPEEIVFADDHVRNVTQARRLGIRAIRCNDPAECAQALREITEIS